MNKLIHLMLLIIIEFIIVSGQHATRRSVNHLHHKHLDSHWSNFKLSHKKVFKNVTHELHRKKIFNRTLAKINELNSQYEKGIISYVSGITQFSDMTPEEFSNWMKKKPGKFLQPEVKREIEKQADAFVAAAASSSSSSLPASIDWRVKGAVNPIKDQGVCGSCWAFSTVSTIESMAAIASGKLPILSEQSIIDCLGSRKPPWGSSDSCIFGGDPASVFHYLKKEKNITINTEFGYPYVSGTTGEIQTCGINGTASSGIRVTDYVSIFNETALQQALANVGPVMLSIEMSMSFQHYESGIFGSNADHCTGEANHAISFVGYGTDDATGLPYYIVRNSWGSIFGMDGYFLWARNQNNSCSINNYIRSYPAMYPIVNVTSMKPLGTLPLYPKCKTKGYYANPGCKTYYLCERNSYNDEINSSNFLYAPTGFLFDQTTGTFKSASKFKCQI